MKRVALINPLPGALAHYQHRLSDVLCGLGAHVTSIDVTSIEGLPGIGSKLKATWTAIRHPYGAENPRNFDRIVVLWPTYGYLDLLRWRGATNVSLVFHDPLPLRRQVGLSGGSAALARQVPGGAKIIVHSAYAGEVLRLRNLPAQHQLPLPMARPHVDRKNTTRVLVLGQFKRARDLTVLVSLAPLLRQRGYEPHIVGRGWPAVPGWAVVDRFLSEEELDEQIVSAACVLLPYKRLFQSDIAVRCAEHVVPVVGPAQSNVADLYGGHWPGSLQEDAPPQSWVSAVEAVTALEVGDLAARAQTAYGEACDRWKAWLDAN